MRILAIGGATATGKSELAVECAKRLNGEVISCDALLVYRGLNIGTAKPTEEERGGIRHHLIDVASPYESFSVSDFERLALAAVEEISSRGKVPILCGGTGFYMSALLFTHSFGNVPAQPEVRREYEEIAREKGREYLFEILQKCDPESAEKLHPNDVKRVIRALEIYRATGRKKSEQCDGETPRFDYKAFAVNYPREALYERIERRVDKMFEAGLVAEVEALLASGVPENAQCMQGIGYKEVVEMLKNGALQSTTSDIIKQNTRNYAKRQLTFFKKLPQLCWVEPKDGKLAAEEICAVYES